MKHLLAFFVILFGITTFAFAADNTGLDEISAYNGTWHTTIVHHATTYSKARTETSITRNDCWRSAEFYTCHQFVNGTSAALIVYTYDAKSNTYHTNAITPDGKAAGGGTLLISGSTWTYPWTDKDGTKTVYFHIINIFTNPDTIVFRSEFSYDNIHWTRAADGTEHRILTP